MGRRRVFGGSVLFSGAVFLFALYLNRLAFPLATSEAFSQHWIYFPAGLRLLMTLVLGEAGAAGILLASWAMAFVGSDAATPLRAFFNAPLAAGTAYIVYRFGVHYLHMEPALRGLTPGKLLILVFANALICPLLMGMMHVGLYQSVAGLPCCLLIHFIGDLAGTLSVVYLMKWILSYVRLPAADATSDDMGANKR